MIDEIRKQLIEIARLKQTWLYSQLNNQLQINFNLIVLQSVSHIGKIMKNRINLKMILKHQSIT